VALATKYLKNKKKSFEEVSYYDSSPVYYDSSLYSNPDISQKLINEWADIAKQLPTHSCRQKKILNYWANNL
jgi:hypothetical protein